MKRFLSVLILVITLISLSACNSSDNTTVTVDPAETNGPTIPFDLPQYTLSNGEVDIVVKGTFAFEDEKSVYGEGDPGVITEGFVNNQKTVCENEEQAIALAKNECTKEYNVISVSYDKDMMIYRVTFWNKNYAGGGQTVYVDQYGVTQLIVYGE